MGDYITLVMIMGPPLFYIAMLVVSLHRLGECDGMAITRNQTCKTMGAFQALLPFSVAIVVGLVIAAGFIIRRWARRRTFHLPHWFRLLSFKLAQPRSPALGSLPNHVDHIELQPMPGPVSQIALLDPAAFKRTLFSGRPFITHDLRHPVAFL